MSVMARTILGMRPADSLNGPVQRTKFISVIAFAEAIKNYERIRLLLGGEPRR